MTRPARSADTMPPSAAQLEDVLDAVRRDGGRVTRQRRLVIEIFFDQARWVTAAELVELVRPRWAGVNESTAYRILELLESLGHARHTHLGHGPAYWHRAGGDGHPLFCDRCGVVLSMPRAWLEPAVDRARDELGFEVDLDHFAWSGSCAACR
ncbi:MAG: transcriptional repressor [Ilumatobacteraceae bacterium]